VATIVNADNGEHSGGAMFDFTSAMTDGVLKPDESTKTRTIKFEVKDVHLPPLEEKNILKNVQLAFVNADIQILGEVPDAAPDAAAGEKAAPGMIDRDDDADRDRRRN